MVLGSAPSRGTGISKGARDSNITLVGAVNEHGDGDSLFIVTLLMLVNRE